MQVHPELNTQGIALSDLTQRAQIGQKHKLLAGTPVRMAQTKKRIKLEQPLMGPTSIPKVIPQSPMKPESECSDYSHTTDETRHLPISEIDHRFSNIVPIKVEPVDAYEIHQTPKKKV